ncbi:MAG TPA: Ig-like domain-containing protein, partial [Nitrospirota bacterium]|nr:Ig-like domain-containing protein [Nitrospirota bacterium]
KTIPCTMSYSGTTAIFTPLNVLASTTPYTATVSAGVKDLAGNAMPNSYIWSFTTGTVIDPTPPIVTATNPPDLATGVDVNTTPTVTFSEPVDPITIKFTITFTLNGVVTTLPCTMSYSGVTAIFTPASKLMKNVMYTATVSAGVRDLAGNAMPSDYRWTFTTSRN